MGIWGKVGFNQNIIYVNCNNLEVNQFIIGFQPGKEYVYDYQSQTLTGIPDSSSQHAGLVIRGHVILTFPESYLQDHQAYMLIQQTEAFKINKKILNLDTKLTQFNAEQKINASISFQQALESPIRFSYEDGMVSLEAYYIIQKYLMFQINQIKQITVNKSHQPWVVNLKRGVLNMFQVNLKKQNEILEDDQTEFNRPGEFFVRRPSKNPTEQDSDYYRAFEVSFN